MKKMQVKTIIEKIMNGEIHTYELMFYIEDIGYLEVDEIYFTDEGLEVHNNITDIKNFYCFDEFMPVQII